MDKLSSSMHELRSKIEEEAGHYRVSPEEVLLRSIRTSSSKLNENLRALREKGATLLSEPINSRLESATAYFEQLDTQLASANDIYQVKNEAFDEAKQKLSDLAQWSSSFIVRNGHAAQAQEASD